MSLEIKGLVKRSYEALKSTHRVDIDRGAVRRSDILQEWAVLKPLVSKNDTEELLAAHDGDARVVLDKVNHELEELGERRLRAVLAPTQDRQGHHLILVN